MKRLKYYLSIVSALWRIITRGRPKTPKEKLFDLAKKQGYSTIHKIPKRYKGKKKYRKAPSIR